MNFKEWFESKLIVGRYPLPTEIQKSNYDVIINVSDEYIFSCHAAAQRVSILYYWFPMNECTSIGMESIYGAMQILRIAENQRKCIYTAMRV